MYKIRAFLAHPETLLSFAIDILKFLGAFDQPALAAGLVVIARTIVGLLIDRLGGQFFHSILLILRAWPYFQLHLRRVRQGGEWLLKLMHHLQSPRRQQLAK